jgi:hypothetical protein
MYTIIAEGRYKQLKEVLGRSKIQYEEEEGCSKDLKATIQTLRGKVCNPTIYLYIYIYINTYVRIHIKHFFYTYILEYIYIGP